jgi:hypothetical protein
MQPQPDLPPVPNVHGLSPGARSDAPTWPNALVRDRHRSREFIEFLKQTEHMADDTPDRALQIDERIVAAERGLQIRRERLAAFRARARKERIDGRLKAKAAAVVELERRLGVDPVTVASVRLPEIVDRVGSFAEPAKRLAAEVAQTIRDWPLPDLPDDDDEPDAPSAAVPVALTPHKPAAAMETLATA